jgi:hypothetical protein
LLFSADEEAGYSTFMLNMDLIETDNGRSPDGEAPWLSQLPRSDTAEGNLVILEGTTEGDGTLLSESADNPTPTARGPLPANPPEYSLSSVAAWRIGYSTGYRHAIVDHDVALQTHDNLMNHYDPSAIADTSSVAFFYIAEE